MNESRISQFDQVQLHTTKNVKYLSAPPGANVSPHGIWVVAAAIQNDLLLTKDNCTIRVPIADVLKVRHYDIHEITKVFGKLRNG